jgi:hypothetical protein
MGLFFNKYRLLVGAPDNRFTLQFDADVVAWLQAQDD